MSSIRVEWSALLVEAVTKPGVVSKAYQQFWNYSTGNQLLALFQCMARGIPPGPIHTFMGWREIGRNVRKGEKALTLCMPVEVRTIRERKSEVDGEGPLDEPKSCTRFIYRPHWFVLAQTEGAEYQPAELPEWNEVRALATLGIVREEYQHPNGNIQGYAQGRKIGVSPIAFTPHRTLLHEIAHVVLGHTAEIDRMEDEEVMPVDQREVEAESVALICCESLELTGAEYSRGYIQHWLRGETIPERSAQRIFRAADRILKAGQATTGSE